METIKPSAVVAEAIRGINGVQFTSANNWDAAIETETRLNNVAKAAEARKDADACMDLYERAIETIDNRKTKWLEAARNDLENAQVIERRWGNDSDAKEALKILYRLSIDVGYFVLQVPTPPVERLIPLLVESLTACATQLEEIDTEPEGAKLTIERVADALHQIVAGLQAGQG